MVKPEMSKLPDLGSNSSLACRALPALALAPPKWQNEKSSGSGSVVVKSKKSSGKLELWFTNLLKQFPNFINLNFVTTAKKQQHLFNCNYRVDQKKCITFTNKNFKHFVFKNYYSVGRRNLTAWSTHEYSLLSNFDTLQISSFWIRSASSFFNSIQNKIKWGIFLGHPVAIYVTIRIRSLFSNILNQLKQLLWESLSSFSEIPIFPKKIPLLGTKKLSTLYLETTHLFGPKLWLQEVPMGAEVSSLTGSA